MAADSPTSPFPPNSPIYRKSPNRARLIAVVAIVLLFLIGFVPKYLHSHSLAKETHEDSIAPPGVQVEAPRVAEADPLLLPGTMQSITNTIIQARATGYVRKFYVDIGARVKQGQLLAEIESPDTDQQAIQATAQTAQSQATVGQSVAQVERGIAAVRQAEAAFESAVAKKAQAIAAEYQAKANVAQRKRQVEVARGQLTQARAQYQLSYTTVKRYESLLQQGFVAQQDYDQAAATYKTNAAAVLSAEASVFSAQADEKAAEETVRAQQALVRSAQSDADAAHANIRAAQQDVEASRQVVSANQSNVAANVANERRYAVLRNFEKVTAPFDGVITARNFDIGSLITAGGIATSSASGSTVGPTPSATGTSGAPASVPGNAVTIPTSGLFGIARVDSLWLLVYVPQADADAIPIGASAKVVIKQFPGVTFPGKVVLRSGAVDAQSRTRLIEIEIPNRDNRVLPGMYAQAILQPTASRRSLRVPSDTVMYGTDGTRLAVVDRDSVIHIKNVTLGRDFGTEIEVLDGVQMGDRLVKSPTDDMRDGEKVRIQKPKKEKGDSSGQGRSGRGSADQESGSGAEGQGGGSGNGSMGGGGAASGSNGGAGAGGGA